MSGFPSRTVDKFWNAEATALLVGEVVRGAPGLSTAPGALRSDAAAVATAESTVGVVVAQTASGGAIDVVMHGRALVRLETGLVLAQGNLLYVSANVPGSATNVAPANAFPIAVLRDATGYSATNPVVQADIIITGSSAAAATPQNVTETGLINGQGAILEVGEVVRISGVPANTITRSRADLIVTVNNTIGVVVAQIGVGGTGSVVTGGRASIRLAAGVVPAVGEILWVSTATGGRATNIQPNLNNYMIGVIKDTTGYADPGNPVVIADIFPQGSITAFPDRIPIGEGATASGSNAVAIGTGSATNNNTVSIGSAGVASGDSSIVIGTSTTASGLAAISIGDNSSATGSSSVALGRQADASGSGAVSIGLSARVTVGGASGVAVGNDADVNGSNGVAIGTLAISGTSGNAGAIAIGSGANAAGTNGIVIGTSARGDTADTVVIGGTAGGANVNTNSTIIGASANAGGALPTGIVAVGQAATVNGTDGIAIGRAATVGAHAGSICIGVGATSSAANECTIGAASAGGQITSFRVLNNAAVGTTLAANSAPAANLAGLVITINNGAVALRTVAIGAAGSGSIAAHRMLQVPD
jgi:hypothetical protein